VVSGPTSYATVAAGARAEVELRRSRFLCRIEPVATEEAARAVVEEERRQHRDARHHCPAFVLGPAGETERSSDDGEPSGTAGAPMLEVLRGRAVSDVVAVVSRYFGGALLGAGGLVRAYSDAVRAGMETAGMRERRLFARYDVDVPHADAGRLEHALRAHDVAVLGVDHAATATLHLAVPVADAEGLSGLLAGLTGGERAPRPAGTAWV
jgi:uncharacterized YigZ family protein